MYLSPLTWGTSDMLIDCKDTHHNYQSATSKNNTQSNFKAKRVTLAKQRNEEPKFVTLLHKITAVHPPSPYFPNASRSKLGEYVRQHFLWSNFPQDVDIGEE